MIHPKRRADITRRAFIKTGAAAVISATLPTTVFAAVDDLLADSRTLSFYNTHTDESLCSCYFRNGVYCSESLESINHILRDHRTGDIKPIDTRLLDTLHALAVHLGLKYATFHIISGYRSPQSNSKLRRKSKNVASKSLHMKGKAIDTRLPQISTRALWRAAVDLKAGGVGYYPTPRFVHIDTGRVRYW